MVDTKQLVVAFEGTSAMGGYWRTILSDYLVKLIRALYGYNEANKPNGPIVQLCMVQFHTHGTDSPVVVQRGPWVNNLNYYLDTLKVIQFRGGAFCDAAIAEGLSEVLRVFPPPTEGQIGSLQRHCILVAASNPYPLSTLVYRPPDYRGQPQSPLCDAEALVKSFHQCCVSLSVICPRQLPKLKSIYYAGKRNPSAVDHTINITKNPHFLVLISDDFKSACADLNQTGITVLPSNHQEAASGSGTPSTSGSSGWRSVPVKLYHRAPANSSEQSSITSMTESATSSRAAQLAQHTAIRPDLSTLDMPHLVGIIGQSSGAAQLAQNTAIRPDLSTLDMPHLLGILGQQSGAAQMAPNLTRASQNRVIQSDWTATEISMPVVKALVQSLPPGHVKVWEGDLTCELHNQTILLTRLQAYWKPDEPALLAKDWPPTINVSMTKGQNILIRMRRAEKLYDLSFVAMHQHRILEQLQELKHVAVIQLPSQKLILSVYQPATLWTGTLYPGDVNIETSKARGW